VTSGRAVTGAAEAVTKRVSEPATLDRGASCATSRTWYSVAATRPERLPRMRAPALRYVRARSTSVRLPYAAVGPYSNQAVVGLSEEALALTTAAMSLTTAVVGPTHSAPPAAVRSFQSALSARPGTRASAAASAADGENEGEPARQRHEFVCRRRFARALSDRDAASGP
jgi:hypothetical protein